MRRLPVNRASRRRRVRIAGRPQISRPERVALSVAGLVIVFGLWQWLSDRGSINPLIWSSPSRIWQSFREMLSDGTLWPLFLQSAKLFAVGFAVSAITGLIAGAMLGWYAKARAIFDPWVSMLYAMPGIALVPLLVVAFGSNFHTQVIVVWLVAVFPVIISVAAGVDAIDQRQLEVSRSFLATNNDVLWRVALPGAVPYLIAGVQQALSLSLIGVVVAEYFVGNDGLGGLILNESERLNTAASFVGVFIFAIAGIILTALLRWCERRVVSWR
jgi:NitT/TauT family transport system permease protein